MRAPSDSELSSSCSTEQNVTKRAIFASMAESKRTPRRHNLKSIYTVVPDQLSAKIVKLYRAKLFMARRFKGMTTISTGVEAVYMATASNETEAGSNLVSKDVLPMVWLANVQPVVQT